jgi:uncharacterized repeat protein (TIGR01451 family)
VSVPIVDDAVSEPTETFLVNLTNAANAVLTDSQGVGTILDDDIPNNPPVAVDDNATTDEDTPVTIPVLGNDSDPDGDSLTVTSVTAAANGTTMVNPDGTITYIPDPDYCGQDSFTYTISDGRGGTDTATVGVTVNCVNDPPVAQDDAATTNSDTAVTIEVLANDSDPDGTLNPATVFINTPPSDGSVIVNSDGTATYTPDPGFSGVDTFTYTVDDNEGLTSNIATVSVTVVSAGADLAVAKSVDNPAPNEGDTVIYTITVTNNGPGDATGVTLSDLLPLGVTYVSDNSGGAYDSATGVWTEESIAMGAIAVLEITATVDAGTTGTTITNMVEVATSDQPDPDDTNNRDSADITIPEEVAGGGGATEGPCEGKVIINEVAWAGTAADPHDEWIELHNLGTIPVDLTGWTLRWRRKHPTTEEEYRWKVVNLSGILLPASESACEVADKDPAPSAEFIKRETDDLSWWVLGKPEEKDESYYTIERRHDETISGEKADLLYDTTEPYEMELTDLGDVIELLNDRGEVVDTANASNPERDGWPAGSAATFATMERTDPLAPDTWENWHTNLGIITRGLDANERPLIATADTLNSKALEELALNTQLPPTKTRAGARLEVGLDLPREDRKALGWPWIRVTRPDLTEAAGGGGAVEAGAGFSFSGRYSRDLYWLGIDTSGLSPGQYNIWIVYGEGKAILVPILVLQ